MEVDFVRESHRPDAAPRKNNDGVDSQGSAFLRRVTLPGVCCEIAEELLWNKTPEGRRNNGNYDGGKNFVAVFNSSALELKPLAFEIPNINPEVTLCASKSLSVHSVDK